MKRAPEEVRVAPEEPVTDAAREGRSILEDVLAAGAAPAPARGGGTLVAEVVDDASPEVPGRVLARWSEPGGAGAERWLAVLAGVTVRVADRVLLACPANWPEPVVAGVLSGFPVRPPEARRAGAIVALRGDECVRVEAASGSAICEVFEGAAGPVVRLCQPDVKVEIAGALRIAAATIELEARAGEARVSATDDVVVRGERVRLN